MISAFDLDADPFAFHPGGRWERILGACVSADRPLTRRELMTASVSGRHPRRIERAKLLRATRAMVRVGLLERVIDPGAPTAFAATGEGFRAIADHGGRRAA